MKYSSFYKGKKCINNMKKNEGKLVSKRDSTKDPCLDIKGKQGQLTIFIILGLVIISAILIFFFYVKPDFFTSSTQLSVDTCVSDVINKEVTALSLQAGVSNPSFNSLYLDENYTFICYTDEYYKPCIVQTPFVTSNFEKTLTSRISQKIKDCYEKSVDDLRAKGYEVLTGNLKTEILIQPTSIVARIISPTVVSSPDASQSFNKFDVQVSSD